MRRIIAIEIPWLTLLGVGSEERLIDTLDAMQNMGCTLLVGDNLYGVLPVSMWEKGMVTELILERLSQLPTQSYCSNTFSEYITHNPSLMDASYGETINTEIKAMCCALHIEDGLRHAVVAIDREVLKCYNQLTTTKDRKSKSHELIHISNYSLKTWLEMRLPQLIFEKHFGDEYMRGNKVVSTFKAGADEDYAKKLLNQAYCEYDGTEDEPKYLYTFDVKNGCFVQFRGDRNREYHGMDLSTEEVYNNVPEYIRLKYHK